MNEDLIEKLALQAHESLRDSGDQPVFNYKFADKFAELIVKECMKLVRDEYVPVMEDRELNPEKWQEPNGYWNGYISCGIDTWVSIREHFGIESDE